ncbi:cytochrome P450 [Biscogniauxia mediterranea]|nr:cytochrome P450 [Biscogniauxia mediterranea]
MSSERYFDFLATSAPVMQWPPSREMVVQGLGGLATLFIIHRIALIIYRIWFHPLAKFPGPTAFAMTNLLWLWKSNVDGTGQWQLRDLHRKYGPIVRVGADRIDVDGSIGWTDIYGHHGAGKPEFTKIPGYFFPGDHETVIGARRDDHRRMRRTLNHAFSDAALREQEGLVKKYIALLIQRLGENADAKNVINIVSWLNFTTFDIIGDLSFGESFHSLDNNSYHPYVQGIFKGAKGDAISRVGRAYPILGALVLSWLRHNDMKLGEDNRLYAKAKARARMSLGAEPKDGRRDFMTYLLKTKNGATALTDSEISGHAPLLVIAGSETTATALSGLFFYLGNNPRGYEALVNEVRDAFKNESDITLLNTARLEFLSGCLNEAIRMYPPASDTPPRISPGAEIGGHYIAPGCILSVSQLSTFYNPDNFHDPDNFHPERWLSPTHPLYDPAFANDNRAAFKPFSFGPRDCIGKNLAMSEMRLIMASILFHYDFKLEEGQSDWQSSQMIHGLWEKGPLNITMYRRKQLA